MSEILVLPARAGLAEAEACLARLREAGAPVLDARGVEEISAALVLVLAAHARHAPEGGRLAVIAPSPGFVDAFADLGLFQDLMRMEFRT